MIMKYLIFSLMLLLVWSCDKAESPNNEQEHEAITSMALLITNTNFNDTIWFDDPDGDGGNAPVLRDSILLNDSSTYQVSIRLFNKTKTPVQEITEVIRQQGGSHEFYFLPDQINLLVSKVDRDENGFPLGLSSVWQTQQADSGSIRIRLMHKPLIKGPNDAPEKGHSDIDIIFPIQIL